MWHTQFGFRSQRGTADAIFVAKRLIEQTWSKHEGRLVCLALDWAKAFDSILPENLVYTIWFAKPRRTVRDGGHQSCPHAQRSCISQGCPLSPVLFPMLMSVLISRRVSEFTGFVTLN